MLTFLKTVAVICCMTLIIPIMVWGNSGSWRHALHALKWYWICMGIIAVPAVVLAIITLLPRLYE
jgi:hypothetical protein